MKKHGGLVLFGFGLLALLALAVILIFIEGTSLALDAGEEALQESIETAVDDEQSGTEYVGDLFVTDVPYGQGITSPEPLSSDPVYGTVGAPITLIEFGDFQCAACADTHEALLQVVNEYRDYIELVWKDFPLTSSHQFAESAAVAARCAQNQDAFWEYHDALYARQAEFLFNPWIEIAGNLGLDTESFKTCLETESTKRYVVEGYFIARALDLVEAPTFYINDTQLTGAQTYEELKAAIEAELAALGIDPVVETDAAETEETDTTEEDAAAEDTETESETTAESETESNEEVEE